MDMCHSYNKDYKSYKYPKAKDIIQIIFQSVNKSTEGFIRTTKDSTAINNILKILEIAIQEGKQKSINNAIKQIQNESEKATK